MFSYYFNSKTRYGNIFTDNLQSIKNAAVYISAEVNNVITYYLKCSFSSSANRKVKHSRCGIFILDSEVI